MADFTARIATPTGEIVERSYSAPDEGALRRELEDKDYLVLDLRRKSALADAVGGIFRLRPRISQREFLFFNQEMRALIRAGLPILASLDILIERRKNQVFRRSLVDIRDRVRAGESLSEAFAAQGDLYPKLYASSLASGERSGELPTVLTRYVDYTRTVMAIKRKVVGALIYPSILLVLSVAVVALMVFFIIPKFNEFLKDFGTDLPLITSLIVSTSLFLVSKWKLVVGALVGAVVAFVLWQRTSAAKLALDRMKMKIPVAGGVIHDYAQTRFTRTLATLVAGGIPLVTSLELAARAVGNLVFEKNLLGVAGRVREGQALWESLERTGLMSDISVEMIKVGESTGALEEMLNSASEFTEEEIDYKLTRLITVVEPMMLIVMALVVGGMMMAIYLPLIQTAGQAKF